MSSCAAIFAASWVNPRNPSVSRYTTSSLSVVTLFLFVSFYSGTPDECLTPVVSHPLTELHFIDSGLGSQVSNQDLRDRVCITLNNCVTFPGFVQNGGPIMVSASSGQGSSVGRDNSLAFSDKTLPSHRVFPTLSPRCVNGY